MPLPCLVNPPAPPIVPLKVVEVAVPTVRLLLPSTIDVPATPVKSWIVWLPLAPEMSKVTPLAVRATLLNAEILLSPESANVPPEIVVVPV